jgi:hypothetical protein
MKKISIIGIIYLICTALLTLAALLMMFASVASGAVSQFPWFLLLYIVLFALGMFGMIWSSKLRAHKPWAWSWGIVFVSFNLILGLVYFFFGYSIPGLISLAFNIFVMYALITERQLFFPAQQGQTSNVGRTLILPIIIFVVLGVAGFFAYRAFLSYSVGALKTDSSKINDILIQTSITDTMVSAENYSMSHNGSFMGYQWPLASEVPQCSGGLTVNISTDGTKLAAMGKSCSNPSISYCGALPLVQSMATIPESIVTPSKFDCNGGSQLQSTTGIPNIQPIPMLGQTLPDSSNGHNGKANITGVTPLLTGDQYFVRINGTGFSSNQYTIFLNDNQTVITGPIDSTEIAFTLPASFTPGTYKLYVKDSTGLQSNSVNLKLPAVNH